MKKVLFCLSLLLGCITSADTININPDPNGDPWIVGGIPEITPERRQKLLFYPSLILTPQSAETPLPSVVDNSLLPFFRPIFRQELSSCAQASGVGYGYTYEINRIRIIAVNQIEPDPENIYPTHYT